MMRGYYNYVTPAANWNVHAMGAWSPLGAYLFLIVWILVVINLILLAIWLWKQIKRK